MSVDGKRRAFHYCGPGKSFLQSNLHGRAAEPAPLTPPSVELEPFLSQLPLKTVHSDTTTLQSPPPPQTSSFPVPGVASAEGETLVF